jgi:hypothetical protein
VQTEIIAYRIPEAVKVSGISRSSLYRIIADRQLKVRKVRGMTLILRDDLEALLRHAQEA